MSRCCAARRPEFFPWQRVAQRDEPPLAIDRTRAMTE
jgi:hypothetical protein